MNDALMNDMDTNDRYLALNLNLTLSGYIQFYKTKPFFEGLNDF